MNNNNKIKEFKLFYGNGSIKIHYHVKNGEFDGDLYLYSYHKNGFMEGFEFKICYNER